MLVVYAHAIDAVKKMHLPIAQINWGYWENFGAIGVDVFFVISGFIMAYISQGMNGKKDAVSFLAKRVIRIYPLYLLLTLVLVVLNPPTIQMLAKDITVIPLFDTAKEFMPITINVAWSLAFEMFFYLLVFSLILEARGRHLTIAASILTTLAIIGSIFHFEETRLRFFFNPILLEFVFGIIIYWLFTNNKKMVETKAWFILLLAISGFLCLICLGYKNVSEVPISIFGNEGLLRILIWGIPSALLVASFVFMESSGKASFKNSFLNLIGNASYSIYLMHFVFFHFLLKLNLLGNTKIDGDLLVFLLFVIATLMGMLVYRFIESPLLKSINKFIGERNKNH